MPRQDEAEPADVSAPRRGATVQSVSVAMRFLTTLADAGGPLSLGEVARRSGSGSSTAHRYLQSLVAEGLAQQDPASGQYDLGPTALTIGIAALRRIDPIDRAAEAMKALTAEVAASGGVAIWTDRGPTLVRWYRSAQFSISSLGLGDILPIDNSACGLVFQAWLPAARIEAARSLQPDGFRGTVSESECLHRIRTDGWCEMRSHLLRDIRGQAVPVFDAQGEIVAVMTTIDNLGETSGEAEKRALIDAGLRVNAPVAAAVRTAGR